MTMNCRGGHSGELARGGNTREGKGMRKAPVAHMQVAMWGGNLAQTGEDGRTGSIRRQPMASAGDLFEKGHRNIDAVRPLAQ